MQFFGVSLAAATAARRPPRAKRHAARSMTLGNRVINTV
jgi:hypothetical protein